MYAQPIHQALRSERRRAIRGPYRTHLTYASGRRRGLGRVRDISFEGLYFETPRRLAVGDRIDMAFRFRHTRSDVPIAGEVRHVSAQGAGVRLTW